MLAHPAFAVVAGGVRTPWADRQADGSDRLRMRTRIAPRTDIGDVGIETGGRDQPSIARTTKPAKAWLSRSLRYFAARSAPATFARERTSMRSQRCDARPTAPVSGGIWRSHQRLVAWSERNRGMQVTFGGLSARNVGGAASVKLRTPPQGFFDKC